MGIKITKKTASTKQELDEATKTGKGMTEEDLAETIKIKYKHAKSILPDYKSLKDEINKYDVELPEVFSVQDLSGIRKLYAITQEFLSRVTTIASLAIDNLTRWERIRNYMNSYIQDCTCNWLIKEEVINLPNSKIQEAYVRTKLKKHYNLLQKIDDFYSEAKGFNLIVETKKKDLASVLMNLTRQRDTLKLESQVYRD